MSKLWFAALTMCAAMSAYAANDSVLLAQSSTTPGTAAGTKTPANPNETQPGMSGKGAAATGASSTTGSAGTGATSSSGTSSTGSAASSTTSGTGATSGSGATDTGTTRTNRRARGARQMKG